MRSTTDSGEVTIGDLLSDARRRLAAAPFEPARREAALLLTRVLDRGEASILAHTEEAVPASAADRFRGLLERRLAGEPVAYLFGEREFYGRSFDVDRRVLVPRPETEHLVEAVLGLDMPARPRIVDIGTGSGAIAVTLALEIPGARLLAIDFSVAALAVARANVRRHEVGGCVTLAAIDLVSALRLAEVDLMVSNPPYIDPLAAPRLSTEVTGFEPHLALFAPDRGRAVIRRLLEEAAGLATGTHLVIEIGHDQGEWLETMVAGDRGCPGGAQGHVWELVDLIRDYASIPRTAVLRRRIVGNEIITR